MGKMHIKVFGEPLDRIRTGELVPRRYEIVDTPMDQMLGLNVVGPDGTRSRLATSPSRRRLEEYLEHVKTIEVGN